MEHVVLERLDVDTVERYQAISSQNIDTGCNHSICTWNICSQTTEISWRLLQISEMLSQELDRVLWPIFKEKRDGLFEVSAYILSLEVILGRHILLRLWIINHLLVSYTCTCI